MSLTGGVALAGHHASLASALAGTLAGRVVAPLLQERAGSANAASAAGRSSVTLPDGYGPQQIARAYGFDQVSFGSSAQADGTGQTIAIVDAYHDPNLAADLAVFDKTFGLPSASLAVVNQGGSPRNLPAANGDWAGEIALDVEWAHAMAPGAKILLVEANSDSISDLLAAVDTARSAPGVSVVSMSWGGGEFSGQTRYDSHFTTPSGHAAVSFVASSGDDGSWSGPSWPATSPNVLSVGGTSLATDASGTYRSESGWNGSGGGASSYETCPTYQTKAQRTGLRTAPDVSYNADPNTGFAVYSSLADSYGDVGWGVVGGTSAGAPQWAALLAIANQGRSLVGEGALDSTATLLPALYSLYNINAAPGAAYTASFHDITTGRTSSFLQAHTGYDGVTGLGTPVVAPVVQLLMGEPGANHTASTAAPVTGKNGRRHQSPLFIDSPPPVSSGASSPVQLAAAGAAGLPAGALSGVPLGARGESNWLTNAALVASPLAADERFLPADSPAGDSVAISPAPARAPAEGSRGRIDAAALAGGYVWLDLAADAPASADPGAAPSAGRAPADEGSAMAAPGGEGSAGVGAAGPTTRATATRRPHASPGVARFSYTYPDVALFYDYVTLPPTLADAPEARWRWGLAALAAGAVLAGYGYGVRAARRRQASSAADAEDDADGGPFSKGPLITL